MEKRISEKCIPQKSLDVAQSIRKSAIINRTNQTKAGVTHFFWRAVGDERTCCDCLAKDGKRFEWRSLKLEDSPGYKNGCRCNAEPDFSDILKEWGASSEKLEKQNHRTGCLTKSLKTIALVFFVLVSPSKSQTKTIIKDIRKISVSYIFPEFPTTGNNQFIPFGDSLEIRIYSIKNAEIIGRIKIPDSLSSKSSLISFYPTQKAFNDDANFELVSIWKDQGSTEYQFKCTKYDGSEIISGIGYPSLTWDGEFNYLIATTTDSTIIWKLKPNVTPANQTPLAKRSIAFPGLPQSHRDANGRDEAVGIMGPANRARFWNGK